MKTVVAILVVTGFALLNVASGQTLQPWEGPGSSNVAAVDILLSLIKEMREHPDRNAIETVAKTSEWIEATEKVGKFFDARRAFVTEVAGHAIVVAGDGSNDVVVITYGDGFDPVTIKALLRKTVKLTLAVGKEGREVYQVNVDREPPAMLLLEFKEAEANSASEGALVYFSPAGVKQLDSDKK